MPYIKNTVLKSNIDKLPLSVLIVCSEDVSTGKEKPRGLVQIVHGMSEYKERYLPLMNFLAENGFASIIHDHRGHGKSVISEKDLGYMYGAGADGIVSDVLQVNEYIRRVFPEQPVIMIGHSMGSLVARCFIQKYDDHVNALVLSGSPSKNGAVGLARLIVTGLQKKHGGRYISKFLEALVFGGYVSKFKKEESRFAWVCSAPEVVEQYEEDPLCGFTFTVDGFSVLFDLLKRTYTLSEYKSLKNMKLPILFIGGADDPCIGGPRRFKAAMGHVNKVGYKKVYGKLYKEMRHEIFNEHENMTVFSGIIGFLNDKFFNN